MSITRSGFELLTLLERRGSGKYTQKYLSEELSLSVGIVNKLMREYEENQYIECEAGSIRVTEAGLEALEPYRVKHAVILAAGFSERLAPVTLQIPKPLVTVHGTRIVDTLIDALLDAGITDITMVIGYKKEQFTQLKEKYPCLNLVENPAFNESGNITTLYTALDKLDSTYICDADLYIHNPEVIRKYEYKSCFFGTPLHGTDDWCFTLSGKKIKSFRMGGEKCCQAIMMAYLNPEDSELMKNDLEKIIHSRGGKQMWWFDALFNRNISEYEIEAKICNPDDVSEVDTINDLIKLDKCYLGIQL